MKIWSFPCPVHRESRGKIHVPFLAMERNASLSFTNEPQRSHGLKNKPRRPPGSVDRRGMLNSIVKELFHPAVARFPSGVNRADKTSEANSLCPPPKHSMKVICPQCSI